jgi:hypothetical protein
LVDLMMQYPEEAWDALQNDYPTGTLRVSVGRLAQARRMTSEERRRALDKVDQLPSRSRELVAVTYLRAWALEDPAGAAQWAWAHPGDARGGYDNVGRMQCVFSIWNETDPASAQRWLQNQPVTPLRAELANSVAKLFAFRGKATEASAWLDPNDAKSYEVALRDIGASMAKADSRTALAWYNALPTTAAKKSALSSIVESWTHRDPAGVANWIAILPPGVDRDEACLAIAYLMFLKDSAIAAEWVTTIDDPKKRTKIAERVFGEWERRDPATARTWFRSLPGLEPGAVDRYFRLRY